MRLFTFITILLAILLQAPSVKTGGCLNSLVELETSNQVTIRRQENYFYVMTNNAEGARARIDGRVFDGTLIYTVVTRETIDGPYSGTNDLVTGPLLIGAMLEYFGDRVVRIKSILDDFPGKKTRLESVKKRMENTGLSLQEVLEKKFLSRWIRQFGFTRLELINPKNYSADTELTLVEFFLLKD